MDKESSNVVLKKPYVSANRSRVIWHLFIPKNDVKILLKILLCFLPHTIILKDCFVINQFPSLFISYQAYSLLGDQLYKILPRQFPNLFITFCPLELTNKKIPYLCVYLFIYWFICLIVFI